MKNKDILDMILQLRRAKFGLEEIKTEAGNSPFLSVDLFSVQVSSGAMKEYFGQNVKISKRNCEKYPVEAQAEYRGISFISVMDEKEAAEVFGYSPEQAHEEAA